jgi:hypothetical protein
LATLARDCHLATARSGTITRSYAVRAVSGTDNTASAIGLTPTLTFASVASAEALNLYALNLGNEEVESGAGGGELGEVGFVVFHTVSMARNGRERKGSCATF